MGKMSRIYGQIAMELRANCNGITGKLQWNYRQFATEEQRNWNATTVPRSCGVKELSRE